MSKIISVLNQKGGVGKTTIAINLARALQRTEAKVLLVDSDPQGSARDWNEANDGELLPVIGLDRATLHNDIKAVQDSYDWIIIDGAPQIAELAVSAIKAADVILMPVQPSPLDLWACVNLVDIIKARQSVTDGLPKAAFIVSRLIKNTQLGKEVKGVLEEFGFPVFRNMTSQRVVYAKSAATGSTVLDTEQNGQAAAEMRAIAQELQEFTN
ncbi:ParA family partition ATPase [Candidatus Albibeggiatoa sp. nov. BB20]|uniref:ParA family partition ATPase n=1 Tax=Candidatus Albibeggiatoa sp. nov. BB20 TaxID=3162723 RepID=UPI00336532B4